MSVSSTGPVTDFVLMNAGAALFVVGGVVILSFTVFQGKKSKSVTCTMHRLGLLTISKVAPTKRARRSKTVGCRRQWKLT